MSPSPGKSEGGNQSIATLIVMIIVLTIIIMFCCFAAPGVRDLCKKIDQKEAGSTAGESTTPTVILLPYGRMLVVDRAVFAQLQADHTGIDFMELSANLIRAHRPGSTPSILDSDTTSKGLSPTSLGFSPPAYEDIFGDKNADLPPSYSEVSLMLRTQRTLYENIELRPVVADEDNSNDDDNNSVRISIEDPPSTSAARYFSSTNDCSVKESSI